ncbi:MAG: hypothetical protein HY943_22740 [Gammaproteobacteria bacterium]|nr:hypothetical protein [Gammaproteobacteria bacterium]
MIKQAEGTKNSKGFGLPPCWVDESGKVQRLLDVEVTDGGLIVRAGWPPERNGDSKAVPGVEALTSTDSEETIAAFRGAADSVYAWSRGQDPECRHYASVTVSATKVQSAVTGKNAVYDYFYPYGREALAKP